jgi:hypothetical protein
MANIFSNFGTKVGNAFTNLGQGGNLFNADPSQIANLSEEDRRRLQREGLDRFANSIGVAAAIGSGDPQRIAMAQNKMRQAKIDKENARAKAEKKAQQALLKQQQDAFLKANPEYQKMIQMNELFGLTPPAAKNRESYVAKDGYRYFVDNNQRVFPGVTVTEKQSQEDIYKENAARIKNIILTEGTSGLTENELAFYDDYIKRTGGNPFNQVLANIVGNENPGTQRNKIYKVINNAYGNTSAESIIKQAMELNGVSREEAIKNLKANNIIE